MRSLLFIRKAYRILIPTKPRFLCTHRESEFEETCKIRRLRNIGILAHIDAGKTTTTERMLFYSGKLNSMGEVHHGNTVTDYMEQERERGITITAAAVTFPWKNHIINLIDTPGHIDFTMEVEQTLNVLDGAVVVLDASAGVEAQTVTVWKQADRYNLPRIVYINKTDRSDADIVRCCQSIESKLDVPTLLIHLPIKENDKFVGIVDLLTFEKILWESPKRGKTLVRTKLRSEEDEELYQSASSARTALIDKLSDKDDELAEIVIKCENYDEIMPEDLIKSLQKATLNQTAVPVLCGSSYKNIGVQTLMDSVILYLPSPEERNKKYGCFKHNLCARAFKVIHDQQRGPLVFLRLYSGKIVQGQKIYNIHQEISEQTGKLMVAYADEFQTVPEIENGNIAVISGLKFSVSGDMVTNNVTAFNSAKRSLIEECEELTEESSVDNLFGIDRTIPEPVFFCSIEPPSLMYQLPLENALKELEREDPSLRVTYFSETGQTVLAGMGELHLEIIRDRIKKNYKIDVTLGPLQIAYKEAPLEQAKTQHVVETKIGHTKQYVNVILSVEPTLEKRKDVLKLDKSPESASNLAKLHPRHLLAVKQGVDVALNHGPKLGCPVVNTLVILHHLEVGRGTSETVISAAITQTVQKLMKKHGSMILEPIMHLEIVSQEEYVSSILADLSRRRAIIQQVDIRGIYKVIDTLAPLAELMNYSKYLRTTTSGTATFSLEFNSYKQMSASEESEAIKRVTGF